MEAPGGWGARPCSREGPRRPCFWPWTSQAIRAAAAGSQTAFLGRGLRAGLRLRRRGPGVRRRGSSCRPGQGGAGIEATWTPLLRDPVEAPRTLAGRRGAVRTAPWVSPEQAGSRVAGERGAAWQGGQRGRRTAQERQVGREEGRLAPWPGGGLGCFLKVARSHPRCRVWEGCGCIAFVRLKYVFGEGTSKDRRPEVRMSEQDGTPTPQRAGRRPGGAGRGRGRPGDRPCEVGE